MGPFFPEELTTFMTRTFRHEFDPPEEDPIAGHDDVELTVQEVRGRRCARGSQTPGAAYGSWAILDALLGSTGDGTQFVFCRPLGEALEVKVALAGLFGRFVARAYLERYYDMSVFVPHLGPQSIMLDGPRRIETFRRTRGDLPDWVACKSRHLDLTVAEAKGSYNQHRPNQTLARALNQAQRIDVEVYGHPVTLERMATATLWRMRTGGPSEPCAGRSPCREYSRSFGSDPDHELRSRSSFAHTRSTRTTSAGYA